MQTQLVPVVGDVVDFGSTGHPETWYQAIDGTPRQNVVLDCMTGGFGTDLTRALLADLTVQVFQGYYALDWTGGATEGRSRAQQAVDLVHTAGYAVGGLVWLDSESWPADATAADAATWIEAWAAAVTAGHLSPGLYVGAGTPLTADELWNLVGIARYWKSRSNVPTPTKRGYQQIQVADNQTLNGVTVDFDTATHDALGSAPVGVRMVPQAHTISAPTPPPVTSGLPTELVTVLAKVGAEITSARADIAQVGVKVEDVRSALPTKGTITLS